MKVLPCVGRMDEPKGRCAPGSPAMLRTGPPTPAAVRSEGGRRQPANLVPYTIASPPHGPYRCDRCGRTSRITPQEFQQLPNLTIGDLKSMGLEHLLTLDLLGAGLTQAHVDDLEKTGFTDFEALG